MWCCPLTGAKKAWVEPAEDVRVAHRFNRLLPCKANLIHSASHCWGQETTTRRMTAVFFWMA